MTIIYLHNSFAYYGGLERIFINKMNYLADVYKYNIISVTYSQCGRPIVYKMSSNIKQYDLDVPLYRQYEYNPLSRLLYYRKMRKLLTQKLLKIIHDNHVSIVIGTTNEYFTMDVMHHLPETVNTILESHTCKQFIFAQRYKNRNNYFKKIFYYLQDIQIYKFVKHASAFITLTKKDALEWQKIRECQVIPNFIPSISENRNKHNEIYKRVIVFGRLEIPKGYDILLNSWSIVNSTHPHWILDIYGDGGEKNNLIALKEHLKLNSSVHINGILSDINTELQKSDIFVLSSRYEGFALTLTEAMSNGIPCIAFDCPYGPSDIIKDGIDGILVENGNTKALAEKICYLIENDVKRKEMGNQAYQNVQRYLPEKIMNLWDTLFKNLEGGN